MAPCAHFTEEKISCPRPAMADCETCGQDFCNQHIQFCDDCLRWFCLTDYAVHVCKKIASRVPSFIETMIQRSVG